MTTVMELIRVVALVLMIAGVVALAITIFQGFFRL